MGKTYKESNFPGSKQSGKAAEYQSKRELDILKCNRIKGKEL